MKTGETSVKQRIYTTVKDVMPRALKTAWWLIKLTVIISFVILLLRYFGVIDIISTFLSPVFRYVGLPGEAALAFVSGYFVNVYSAIAVMTSLQLDIRSITILSVMVLCAHNMITETAVQKKTGSSALRIVLVRTLSAVFLAFILNLIMPAGSGRAVASGETTAAVGVTLQFSDMLLQWLISTGKLLLKMTALILTLTILQALLSEFGVIRWLGRQLKPLMLFFGLPANTAFLWIVANTLGLAYGAAVMIEETQKGNITKRDADLLNHHIAISHSNLEDLLLLTSVGGLCWWMLLSRWAMSLILVWERRLEFMLFPRLSKRFHPIPATVDSPSDKITIQS
ncbi:MAG: nucleoside recognition domain-containing protein [Bacteroidales bacterium]|nr:nucleoside recognition domain-containing protein [Bacteroidales bacterium]